MATSLRTSVLLIWCLLAWTSVSAQTTSVLPEIFNLRPVSADSINSPRYGVDIRGTSTKTDGRLEWLQVMAEFDLKPKWTDQISFTFYVALKGNLEDLPEGTTKPTSVFSGTVTLINVPGGNKQSVDMFLDPNTYKRYGDVFAVALEVKINGQDAGFSTQPASLAARKWWESESPNAVPLLSRFESPFRMVEVDHQGTLQP